MNKLLTLGLVAVFAGGWVGQARADSLRELVGQATAILDDRQGSADPIPSAVLDQAKGVAVLTITKAGLVIGGTGGQGIVVVKNKAGLLPIASWRAPIPVELSGGTFGAQIGFSTSKVIIVLNSEQAVHVFTHPGKLAWNGAASGTAGDDTQSEQVGGLLSDKDVTIYKETGGLFGGATVGGSALKIEDDQLQAVYGDGMYVRDIIENKVKVPDYTDRLYQLLNNKR